MQRNINIQSANQLSIASLALSIAVFILGPIGSIPGIICAHIALRNYKNAGATRETGIAKVGLWIGYLGLILFTLCFITDFGRYTSIDGIYKNLESMGPS